MSRIRRRLKPSVHADLVPMIDIVFQLVIFFMISSTFIQVPGIALTLPQSETAEKVTVTELVITVVDDHSVYLNREQMTFEAADAVLQGYTDEQRKTLSGVVVEGDKTVSYETMVKCLDLLRRNGFDSIGLKMRQDR
ncbi:MAG: biopolymer transporter ExbD [Spirochaetia bacterium]|nr:biopolymer transporter ExbD [Spirochaetia bacterium]